MNYLGLGYSIVSSAYRSYTLANAILGHNISNANTEGYSRQIATLSAASPISGLSMGQIGTGVRISSIQRIRDGFLDYQIRNSYSQLGKYEVMNNIYSQLKVVFPDYAGTTATGLWSQVDKVFSDFSALAASPASAALRVALKDDAVTMANTFNQTYQQLDQMVSMANQGLQEGLDQVNNYLTQIAGYNHQIGTAQGIGQNPNDLMDKRDLAITKLSELINFKEVGLSDGTVLIHMNGIPLVQGDKAYELTTSGVNPSHPSFVSIGWQKGDLYPTYDLTSLVTGGKLGGFLQARDQVLRPIQAQMNEMAQSIIRNVNTYHKAGYSQGAATVINGVTTNIPLFTGENALSIAVNSAVQNNTNLIAAARTVNNPADGENAVLIAGLKNILLNTNTQSNSPINSGAPGRIDPAVALNSLVTTLTNGAGSNSINIAPLPPSPAGTIVVNGVSVAWNNTQSLDQIISNINVALGGLASASFDTISQVITFTGTKQVIVRDAVGDLASKLRLQHQLYSAANINLQQGSGDRRVDPTRPMNHTGLPVNQPTLINISGYNAINFFTVPSTKGTVLINGSVLNFQDTDTLSSIATMISTLPNFNGATKFDSVTQRMILVTANTEINISDSAGNFTQFLNIPGAYNSEGFYSSIMSQINAGASNVSDNVFASEASVTQIQNQIDNVSKVILAEEEAKANEYAKTFEAAVRFAAVMNEMLNVLINGMGSVASSASGSTTSSL